MFPNTCNTYCRKTEICIVLLLYGVKWEDGKYLKILKDEVDDVKWKRKKK